MLYEPHLAQKLWFADSWVAMYYLFNTAAAICLICLSFILEANCVYIVYYFHLFVPLRISFIHEQKSCLFLFFFSKKCYFWVFILL